jgi:hypothetical protein
VDRCCGWPFETNLHLACIYKRHHITAQIYGTAQLAVVAGAVDVHITIPPHSARLRIRAVNTRPTTRLLLQSGVLDHMNILRRVRLQCQPAKSPANSYKLVNRTRCTAQNGSNQAPHPQVAPTDCSQFNTCRSRALDTQVSQRVLATDPPVIVKTKKIMAGHQGVMSLAQGIVHWQPPQQALTKAMTLLQQDPSINGYGPADGLPDLRDALKQKIQATNGLVDVR